MGKYEASTLKKGLQILDLLAENRILTLTEISHMLELNKTTAFRLLHTLEDMNYIAKRGNYFELNTKKFHSPKEGKTSIDWTTLRNPYLLGKNVGENVYIGTLEGADLVMRQIIKPPFNEPFNEEIGDRSMAHYSALGKVILAYLNPDEQQETFSLLQSAPATENTFIDPELLLYHLDVIKKQGFALDDEERFLGLRCIAAPVFKDNKVVAAVAIDGPIERMKRNLLRGLTNKVIAASEKITDEINAYF
ncbi:hypothetical protein CIL03_05695 [Virgibacillus indicus]|uniref:IclR family transcriptional regulator n=1 Tax=Virgibacillus indicus TaxID=2024554 RepID=A0A265NF01_9BACI|nr:IclR family transcriptional regulator [Virgibacillus indicus]OZU90630.1 hypothetical protein CIL03_05695 [Virgibacillus indicus]